MNLKGKKILITGGLGFIGSNLSEKLTNNGAHVDIYDSHMGNNILNVVQLKEAVKRKYHAIFHLAGFSGSLESNSNILDCFQQNSIATVNLFDMIALYSPITKIILSNSRLEYGKPQYLPVDEKHPTLPTSAYGLSKLVSTQMARVYSQTKKLNFTVFRTSNVYGPHKTNVFKGYNLINYFIDQAKANKQIRVFGNGSQLRDYIYIDDLTDAFVLSLKPEADLKLYNLGYGKGISVIEMARLIIQTVGKGKLTIETWPAAYKEIETGSYVSDITKINKDLAFIPKITFQQGIQKSI